MTDKKLKAMSNEEFVRKYIAFNVDHGSFGDENKDIHCDDVKAELLSRLEAGEKAIALIGTAPEGSHPDEQKPRDETWHKERQNWISEVEKLRLNIGLKKGR